MRPTWIHPKPSKRNSYVSLYSTIHQAKEAQASIRNSIASLESQQAQLESELASTTSKLQYVQVHLVYAIQAWDL
jgi:conjugal transfer/entry exclusion protein